MDLYHDGMMCDVFTLGYDFRTRTGRVLTAVGHCTDMTGCLEAFLPIDPQVQRIIVADAETNLAAADVIEYACGVDGFWRPTVISRRSYALATDD